MELFAKLFGSLLLFVYHCFDRVVIHGYLSGLSRPGQVEYFFRKVVGQPVLSKEVLSQRSREYQTWVESYARNHKIPIEWAGKGVRKEDYIAPQLAHMQRQHKHGVYFIFKSMEQGRTFRSTVPRYPTQNPNFRILAKQRSRFTHYYFYIHDEVLGPMVLRVASFFPFRPPTGSTATVLWKRHCSRKASASARTIMPFCLWLSRRPYRRPPMALLPR